MKLGIILSIALLFWPTIGSMSQDSDPKEKRERAELGQTIEMINKLPDINRDSRLIEFYAHLINKHCRRDARKILVAILYVESKFDHMANNHNEDWGLAQINFRTWGKFFNIKKAIELYDPDLNIKTAMSILTLAKNVHGKKKDWWSWYHSWNHIPRKKYAQRVHKILITLGETK